MIEGCQGNGEQQGETSQVSLAASSEMGRRYLEIWMNEWRQRDTGRFGCVNRLRGQHLSFSRGLFTTKSRRADGCTSRMAENYANSFEGIRNTRDGRSCGSQRLGHRAFMRDSKRSAPTDTKLRNLHASFTFKLLGSLFRTLLFSCCFLELSLGAAQLTHGGRGLE